MIKPLFPNERTKIKQTNPKQKTDSQCVKEKEESLKDMKINIVHCKDGKMICAGCFCLDFGSR